MTVLVAAVLGVNLGIFAALYWQQARRWRRKRGMRRAYYSWRRGGIIYEPESLVSRLRWYTLR